MQMPSLTPPQQRPAWLTLQSLHHAGVPHLRDLLGQDTDAMRQRQALLQVQAAGIMLDATHQAVTAQVLSALLSLAQESHLPQWIDDQKTGVAINQTENRPVLHVALRGSHMSSPPWGTAVSQQVGHELERFLAAAESIRNGQWRGCTDHPITDVVNIGIGGSDLGPRMAVEALDAHASENVRVHFVSNPDAWALHSVLRHLRAHQTLFIVQSKTFTTQETLTLAASVKRWLADHGIATAEDQSQHLVAVTASSSAAQTQGFAPKHTFYFWDWVGGRYSVWAAIGLPLAIAIGAEGFKAFLRGGHAMDQHFWNTPLQANMPVLMALLGVWNRNFLKCPTQMLAAYPSRLFQFTRFLQQMDMESNGKSTHIDGTPCQIETGPIVWGGLGIDGQHAYFQLLHQGQHRVPIDFLGCTTEDSPLPLSAEHHRVVLLNLKAQAKALAWGRDAESTRAELMAAGTRAESLELLLPHRTFAGNVPNSTLWIDALTPERLGALVALYEHKVFCQSVIWGIYAFDQWGVELGKSMAKAMEAQSPS